MKKTIALVGGAAAIIAGTLFARVASTRGDGVANAEDAQAPAPTVAPRTTKPRVTTEAPVTMKDPATIRLLEELTRLAEIVHHQIPDGVVDEINTRSAATRRAIAADVGAWLDWRRKRGASGLRPTANELVAYLRHGQSSGLKHSTNARRTSSISTAYGLLHMKSPTQHALVRSKLVRLRKGEEDQVHEPLTAMLSTCGEDLKGLRDAALIAMAHAADLKPREISLLDVEDLAKKGSWTHLRLPSTAAKRAGVDSVRIDAATMRIVDAWRDAAGIAKGGLFRRVSIPREGGKANGAGVATASADTLSKAGGTFVVDKVYGAAITAGLLPMDVSGAAAERVRTEPLQSVLTALHPIADTQVKPRRQPRKPSVRTAAA